MPAVSRVWIAAPFPKLFRGVLHYWYGRAGMCEPGLMVVISVLDGFRAAPAAAESPYRPSRKVFPMRLGRAAPD